MAEETRPLLGDHPPTPARSLDATSRSSSSSSKYEKQDGLSLRVRGVLSRRLASIRQKQKHPHHRNGSLSDDSEDELADIIAHTPALESIFQGEEPLMNSKKSNAESSLISNSLANSYGTLDDHSPRSARSRSQTPSPSHLSVSLSSRHHAPKPSPSKHKRDSPLDHEKGNLQEFFTGPYAELLEELTSPVGKQRRLWLFLIFSFVLYNAIVTPFMLAFRRLWSETHQVIILMTIGYVGDIFFCLDVVLGMYTPFTRDGMYERNLVDIRKHYISTWFVPDLIASVPFDLLLIPFGLRTVLLARFTRFIRFCKFDSYFLVWEQYATQFPQLIRFLKLMLGLMLILHWMGCFWFYYGYEHGFGATTWLPQYEAYHQDITSQYITALWYSTNIVSQVGGDPGLPTNNFERIADFFIAFIAIFVVAMVIGNVTELVSELSADEGELRAKLGVLNRFMLARRLPEDLQKRIRHYYFTLWNRRGVNDEDAAILNELPSGLRTEVALIMNEDILAKVPLFKSSSPGFINSLVLHLKPQTYIPKEIIVKQGDAGGEMFFVSRGKVAVMVYGKVVSQIGQGGWFGEVALLNNNSLRTATVQAINFCDVFTLSHDDLQNLFRTFPNERDVIMHVAETRRAKDLLRKTLSDPKLLARENIDGGFDDAVLVNLIIDLFQPLDLNQLHHNKRHGGRKMSHTIELDGGEKNHSTAPIKRSQTLTMSGLRIDEHGEIIGSQLSDDEDDDLGDECELDGILFSPTDQATTVYFIGSGCVDIFTEDPDVDGLVEHGFDDEDDLEKDGPQHVIRLTSGKFFGCVTSDNYQVTAAVPSDLKDDTIIFALSSNDLPKLHDYYSGLPSDADAADGISEGDLTHARHHMKKSLITFLQRHKTPLDYVKSMVSISFLASQSIEEGDKSWKGLLDALMEKAKAVARNEREKDSRAASLAASPPTRQTTIGSKLATNRPSPLLESKQSGSLSFSTPTVMLSPQTSESGIPTEPVVVASHETHRHPHAHPPAHVHGDHTGPRSHSESPPVAHGGAGTTQHTSLHPTASQLARPPLHRSFSAAGAASSPPQATRAGAEAARDPFSPLVHRPKQTRGSGELSSHDASDLLAQADVNLAHEAKLRRAAEVAALQQQFAASSSPPRTHSRNLDWLTGSGASSSSTVAVSSSTAAAAAAATTQPQQDSAPAVSSQAPVIQRSPSAQSRSTRGTGSISAQQAALSGRRPLRQDPSQSFGFLLQLPGNAGGASSLSLPPISPTLSFSHSTLVSPRMDISAKRGSGSTGIPTPSRRPSLTGLSARRDNFLERSLSNLSAEDLLAISQKSSAILFQRMMAAQQAQQDQPAQGSAPLLTPQPRF